MKLYTEEQVREILKKAFWQDFNDGDTEDNLINELAPIELPTDKEIDNEFAPANEIIDEVTYMFIEGAKWMRDKIQGGNK
jgi:hypothetical protein